MGVLIGAVIGLVIGGIIAARASSKAKAHNESMTALARKPGAQSRAALDKRIPRQWNLVNGDIAERQAQRLAALASLGDFDTLRAELAMLQGPPVNVATVRVIGHAALAVKGQDPAANARAVEAECATLASAGTNALTRRALEAWLPIVRAAAGEHELTENEREEARRFQASDLIRALAE